MLLKQPAPPSSECSLRNQRNSWSKHFQFTQLNRLMTFHQSTYLRSPKSHLPPFLAISPLTAPLLEFTSYLHLITPKPVITNASPTLTHPTRHKNASSEQYISRRGPGHPGSGQFRYPPHQNVIPRPQLPQQRRLRHHRRGAGSVPSKLIL